MSFYALVGDIGGTNARFALVAKGSVNLQYIAVLRCADYQNFEHAVAAYYAKVAQQPVAIACVSFAAPIGAEIQMTNNHWRFNVANMQRILALQQFTVLNDFTAMAYGTLFMDEQDKVAVNSVEDSHCNAPRLVIGPGTGLGVAALVPIMPRESFGDANTEDARNADLSWQAIATEGGHVSFAALDELQLQILAIFQKKYSRVSVERILSGDGIVELYHALSEINRCSVNLHTAADISSAALDDTDAIAVQALSIFCQVLGAVTGDMVLAQGARGGVYLCGGILPRIRESLLKSPFRQSMFNKGRFEKYLAQVPVWLCDADYPGLLGAAAALKMQSH